MGHGAAVASAVDGSSGTRVTKLTLFRPREFGTAMRDAGRGERWAEEAADDDDDGSSWSAPHHKRNHSGSGVSTPVVGGAGVASGGGEGDTASVVSVAHAAPEATTAEYLQSVLPGVDDELDTTLVFQADLLDALSIVIDVAPVVGPTLGRVIIQASSFSELEGEVRAPIVSPALTDVGTLTLRYLVVRPWSPPRVDLEVQRPYWKRTRVWGRRGSGADNAIVTMQSPTHRYRRTHIAENTLLSFVTAASLGAQCIEFDVQLSRDAVPVVHHEWKIKHGGGVAVPVSHVTASQLRPMKPTYSEDDSVRTSSVVDETRVRTKTGGGGRNGRATPSGATPLTSAAGPRKDAESSIRRTVSVSDTSSMQHSQASCAGAWPGHCPPRGAYKL